MSPLVADAIRDHYKPQGPDDIVPAEPISIAVALAEKIDNLAAFWAIGKKPTGSSDPFALRRAALGIIEIIQKNGLRLSLKSIFQDHYATGMLPVVDTDPGVLVDELLAFLHDRFKVYLRDRGFKHDHVNSVLIGGDGAMADDFISVLKRLGALKEFLATEDGTNLLAGYKRAANILKAEQKKGPLPSEANVLPDDFSEPAETVLNDAINDALVKASSFLVEEEFGGAMAEFSAVRTPLDQFFEDVKVNDDDPAIRANRLSLLLRMRDAVRAIADFDQLEG